MAPTIPTIEPQVFTVGETVKWSKTISGYPASEGTLAYFFVNAAGSFTETTSTPNGDTFDIVISATDSGSVTAGDYSGQARYTNTATSEETVVWSGSTEALPEFTDTAYDNRTTAQIALDSIETTYKALCARDWSSMSIRDRSTASAELSEIRAERDRLKREVAQEKAAENIANGLGNPNKVVVRF